MIIIKGMYEILMLPRFRCFIIIVWQKNAVWVPGLNQPIRLNSNVVPVDERLGEKASGLNEDPVLREVAVGVRCEQYSSSYARHAFQYISLTFAASSTFIYAVLKCNWQLIGSEKKINILATFFTPLLSLLLKAVWLDFLKEYTSQVWAFTTYALTKISGKDYHICTE